MTQEELHKLLGITPASDIKECLIRIIRQKGTFYLGFEANDVMHSKPELKTKRIRDFLKWLFDLELVLSSHKEFNDYNFRELGTKYLYSRLIPIEYRGLYKTYPKTCAILKMNAKLTKEMKRFINDNYEKVRVAGKAVLFDSDSDLHLFLLMFNENDHKSYSMETFAKPVDDLIESYYQEWKANG